LQNSTRNLVRLPNQVFGPIQADLNSLAGIVQRGLSLAYSMANLDTQFTNRFKGFAGFTPNNYYNNYQTWSQTSLDTTLGTLQAAGMQGQQLQNEQVVLSSLRTMAETSDGAMEALQVLGEISEQEVQQLMKLRELMLADLQSKQAFQAAIIQQQANAEAAAQQFFEFGGASGDGLTFLPGWH
jgi:P-type conjugative transfer protein TrbJ